MSEKQLSNEPKLLEAWKENRPKEVHPDPKREDIKAPTEEAERNGQMPTKAEDEKGEPRRSGRIRVPSRWARDNEELEAIGIGRINKLRGGR